MRTHHLLVSALGILLLCTGWLAADEKRAFQENLDTAIAEGIKMLESQEYSKFLKTFVDPEQFKKFSELGDIEEFAKKFGEKKGKQLLEVLKSIKGKTPKMEEDGKKATFDIKIEGVSKDSIIFAKVEKYWYIKN